jgi:hypothetical protein
MFHLKRNPYYYTWPLHTQNNETNCSIKLLQPYLNVAANALLKIDTAVISAVLSLDEHLLQKNAYCAPKCFQSSSYSLFSSQDTDC